MKKKILLCVSGGIAAYKAIELASSLAKSGYEVRTVLTESALRFVGPINFAAITHGSVHISLFDDADPIPHITLADWADLIVVAPATANAMAKAAHGIADDLLSSTLLAHTKPVLWVPAMNVHMYSHPATRANIGVLKDRGHHVLDPSTGLLACGYEGQGKYPPNSEVMYAIRTYLQFGRDLEGISVLVSAGGTAEAIDPMRWIGNRSSGKTGLAIARALALRGAEVTLVYAAIDGEVPYYLKEAIQTETVTAMHSVVLKRFRKMDWTVMCAAVSDFTPAKPSRNKIKKSAGLELKLVSTPDILKELGVLKKKGQLLIGFAAETENLEANAKGKLAAKNLDLICVNDLKVAGSDATELILFRSTKDKGKKLHGDKFDVAHGLIDAIKEI
jgi:phosphopantothenoylcysteine decarboxylase/phosphopantothenate--cysteine ligase